MRWLCCGAWVLFFSAGFTVSAAEDEMTREDIRAALAARPRMLRSSSSRVVIVGHNARENLLVSRWAEELLSRIKALDRVPVSFSRVSPFSIHIVSSSEKTPGAEAAWMETPGRRMVLSDVALVDTYEVANVFCRGVLQACVLDVARRRVASGEKGATVRVRDVPSWVSVGLARNLYVVNRRADRNRVLAQWQSGALLPISHFFRTMGDARLKQDPAVMGCLVRWLLDGTDAATVWTDLFDTLASGISLDFEWVVGVSQGVQTPVEFEQVWDRWLLAQRRTVLLPGETSKEDVQRLCAALLLYPGGFGIPLDDQPLRPIPWDRLVTRREARWMDSFSRSKAVDLHIVGAGCGDDVKRVVNAYCVFLGALTTGAEVPRLNRFLIDACGERDRLLLKWASEEENPANDGGVKEHYEGT
ncbi:MAG: hypothetical protein ISS35_08325 [Kiritimatiellae bacterium]|nr:hypothetical protein [Kiritimatiellia bacterium]